ncbi:hypothetical protein [Cupriavidus sp. amp6]|uniref:hypothetical protein n=1 Tax=Cupriavidus sp. amp6 TaxID=388051 RepID=UPI000491AF52|nr:hypothetical protein [Cupriavidus sp. amp6]
MLDKDTLHWSIVTTLADFTAGAEYVELTIEDNGSISIHPFWPPGFDPGLDGICLSFLAGKRLFPHIHVEYPIEMSDLSPKYVAHLEELVRQKVIPAFESINEEALYRLMKTLVVNGSARFIRTEVMDGGFKYIH